MFCFKQKTADEMRMSDWSSDVCSSDLPTLRIPTIQTSRTPTHDHHGLGAALVAYARGRRAGGAVAGDGDVLGGVFHVGVVVDRLGLFGLAGHFSVFFLALLVGVALFGDHGIAGGGHLGVVDHADGLAVVLDDFAQFSME